MPNYGSADQCVNIEHEPKITPSCVDKLINSGAIICACRLGSDDFESHALHPELISTSLLNLSFTPL